MSDNNRGIYKKYNVRRTDGSSAPGKKHEKCTYFVIDIEHDAFAYAKACAASHPQLHDDLMRIVEKR
jgi:hypothetical protein